MTANDKGFFKEDESDDEIEVEEEFPASAPRRAKRAEPPVQEALAARLDNWSSRSAGDVIDLDGESTPGFRFPLIALVCWILYPVGLVLSLIGLVTGPNRGCFGAMLILFLILPGGCGLGIYAITGGDSDIIHEIEKLFDEPYTEGEIEYDMNEEWNEEISSEVSGSFVENRTSRETPRIAAAESASAGLDFSSYREIRVDDVVTGGFTSGGKTGFRFVAPTSLRYVFYVVSEQNTLLRLYSKTSPNPVSDYASLGGFNPRIIRWFSEGEEALLMIESEEGAGASATFKLFAMRDPTNSDDSKQSTQEHSFLRSDQAHSAHLERYQEQWFTFPCGVSGRYKVLVTGEVGVSLILFKSGSVVEQNRRSSDWRPRPQSLAADAKAYLEADLEQGDRVSILVRANNPVDHGDYSVYIQRVD
ncbi:MAG: hypothetical protein NUW37_15590 [Planctomycetes bacterium]|nr:hypothetical protein [Planctomycetota bacterium]